MPRFNGTGPFGFGPATGWGLGPCGAGMAWRRGWGFARRPHWRGFLRRFWGTYPSNVLSKKEEEEILTEEAALLEEELKAIKARLAELKGQEQ